MIVTQADLQEIAEKFQKAAAERADLARQVADLDAYMLRLEGAAVFIQSKLGTDAESGVQADTQAAIPADVSAGQTGKD